MYRVILSRAFSYLTLALGLFAVADGTKALAASNQLFFPLKDVRAGMKGSGKTVFSGTRVEEFQVEILGVIENSGPRQAIILARLSGGPLERTGVMQGMSGSPVYIDGKLLGAVAMAFPFSKEPIAGIRPISEMVATDAVAEDRRPQTRIALSDKSVIKSLATADSSRSLSDTRPIEIATPVSFSGFTAATLEHFGPQLRAIGLEPRQGISGGQSPTPLGSTPLEPGSMITVQLVSGDLNMGADGTVTHIDGNRVYAFGHRFLSLGATELPFTRSAVLALLPNLSASFKISASGEWLGSVTSDLTSAISGEIGRRPRLVPVSITVNGGGKRMQYRMNMVQDRLLSPLLIQMLVYSTIDATERTLGSGTVALRGRADLEGAAEPLMFDNMFAGDFNVPMHAALSTALPVAYALQNSLEQLRLKSVDLVLDAYSDKKQMTIEQIWPSRREVRPGDTIQLNILLSAANGREVTKTVDYEVPVGSSTGPLFFTAADGSTINASEQRYISVIQPQPADRMVHFLNSLHGSNKALIRVWRSDPAYSIDGHDLPDPPASLALILARSAAAPSSVGRTSTLAQIEFADGSSVISGSKTIQVDVKE